MNLRMPDLKKCLEVEGFSNVVTVLSSGNVVFDTKSTSEKALEKKIEKALEKKTGRHFLTIIRRTDFLNDLLEDDPFSKFDVSSKAKRVVTFLKEPRMASPKLPIVTDVGVIHAQKGAEVFVSYVPNPKKGGAFMAVIEKTYTKEVTTRTLETVKKVAKK